MLVPWRHFPRIHLSDAIENCQEDVYFLFNIVLLSWIIVIDHHFKGPFQDIDYNYYPYKDSDEGKTPVANINVASIIQQPLNHSILDTGPHLIEGIAWTGIGKIAEVEISTDGGESWKKADLIQDFRCILFRAVSMHYLMKK